MRADGTLLAASFALPPNSRSYCGRPSFREALRFFLSKPSKEKRLRLQMELSRFTAHHAYLRLIAGKNRRKPFDAKVAEALWLGNGLLARVKKADLQRMIVRNFCGRGMLSEKRAVELAEDMPDGFVAHHSFHVLYLHTISGVIEPSVRNADECRVSWGRVVRPGRDSVLLKSQKLVLRRGRLCILASERRARLSCAGIRLVPDIKEGDLVACHWGVAVMKIFPRQAEWLEKCTRQNIAAANRQLSQ